MQKFALGMAPLFLLYCCGADDSAKLAERTAGPPCLCLLWEIEENPDGTILYAAEEHLPDTECADPQWRIVNEEPDLGGQLCEEGTCLDLAVRGRPTNARLSTPKASDFQLEVGNDSGLQVVGDLTKVVRFVVPGTSLQVLARIFVVEGDPGRYPGMPKPPYRLMGVGYEIASGPAPDIDFNARYSKTHIKKVRVDDGVLTHQFDLRLGNMTYRIITTPKPL